MKYNIFYTEVCLALGLDNPNLDGYNAPTLLEVVNEIKKQKALHLKDLNDLEQLRSDYSALAIDHRLLCQFRDAYRSELEICKRIFTGRREDNEELQEKIEKLSDELNDVKKFLITTKQNLDIQVNANRQLRTRNKELEQQMEDTSDGETLTDSLIEKNNVLQKKYDDLKTKYDIIDTENTRLGTRNYDMHEMIMAIRKHVGAWDTPHAPSSQDVLKCIINKIDYIKTLSCVSDLEERLANTIEGRDKWISNYVEVKQELEQKKVAYNNLKTDYNNIIDILRATTNKHGKIL